MTAPRYTGISLESENTVNNGILIIPIVPINANRYLYNISSPFFNLINLPH